MQQLTFEFVQKTPLSLDNHNYKLYTCRNALFETIDPKPYNLDGIMFLYCMLNDMDIVGQGLCNT